MIFSFCIICGKDTDGNDMPNFCMKCWAKVDEAYSNDKPDEAPKTSASAQKKIDIAGFQMKKIVGKHFPKNHDPCKVLEFRKTKGEIS